MRRRIQPQTLEAILWVIASSSGQPAAYPLSWQLRYGYDFAALGVPELTFFTAYIHGDGLKKAGADREWERDVDVSYAFQGKLKRPLPKTQKRDIPK